MTYPVPSPLSSPTLERRLRPGWYLYWQKQIYQIQALHLDNLLVEVVNIATDEMTTLSLDTLLTGSQGGATPLLAAPSLTALQAEIAAFHLYPQPGAAASLPPHLLTRADNIIQTVEAVERLLAQAQHRAQLHGETFRRTQSLQQAVRQLEPPIAWPTFYKYRRLYQQGNQDKMGANNSVERQVARQLMHLYSSFLDTIGRICP